MSDLAAARQWYEAVLGLSAPELEPVEGVAEYEVGSTWLQLGEDGIGRSGWVLRIGVTDVRAERERLLELGAAVQDVEEIAGVTAFCDCNDPDGTRLSFYTVLTN